MCLHKARRVRQASATHGILAKKDCAEIPQYPAISPSDAMTYTQDTARQQRLSKCTHCSPDHAHGGMRIHVLGLRSTLFFARPLPVQQAQADVLVKTYRLICLLASPCTVLAFRGFGTAPGAKQPEACDHLTGVKGSAQAQGCKGGTRTHGTWAAGSSYRRRLGHGPRRRGP